MAARRGSGRGKRATPEPSVERQSCPPRWTAIPGMLATLPERQTPRTTSPYRTSFLPEPVVGQRWCSPRGARLRATGRHVLSSRLHSIVSLYTPATPAASRVPLQAPGSSIIEVHNCCASGAMVLLGSIPPLYPIPSPGMVRPSQRHLLSPTPVHPLPRIYVVLPAQDGVCSNAFAHALHRLGHTLGRMPLARSGLRSAVGVAAGLLHMHAGIALRYERNLAQDVFTCAKKSWIAS